MIIKELKTVFLHRPKTAGTSIEYSFGYWGNTRPRRKAKPEGRHFNLKRAIEYLEKENENIDDYYFFTVVRNPYDRIFSTFWHWVEYNVGLYGLERAGIHREDFDWYLKQVEYFFENRESVKMTSEFSFEVTRDGHPLWFNTLHLENINYWITCDYSKKINVEFLSFENLDKGFKVLQDKFGRDACSNLVKHGQRKRNKHKETVTDWYTPRMADIVEKIYADELQIKIEESFE